MAKCKMKIDFWNSSNAIYGMLYDFKVIYFKGKYFKMSKIKFFQLQKMANIFEHPFLFQKHVCIGSRHHFDNLKVVHVFNEQFKHHIYQGNGFIGTFYGYKMSNMKFTDQAKLFQAANFCVFICSKFLLRE